MKKVIGRKAEWLVGDGEASFKKSVKLLASNNYRIIGRIDYIPSPWKDNAIIDERKNSSSMTYGLVRGGSGRKIYFPRFFETTFLVWELNKELSSSDFKIGSVLDAEYRNGVSTVNGVQGHVENGKSARQEGSVVEAIILSRFGVPNLGSIKLFEVETQFSLTPLVLTSDIPAYLASDNLPHAAGECGMWDSINEKFYGNANTSGAFSVENELDEYVEVDLTGICINGKYQRVAVENTEIPQVVWNGVNARLLMLNGKVVWQEQCIVEIYESLRSTNAFINIGTTFYNTDKIEIRGAITDLYSEDKYILAPSVWNDSNNRFAMLGFCQNKFAVGYGSYITANTELDAQRDSKTRTWTYENKVFSIVELSVTRNVSNINFGAETKELRLFWGYNSITNGTLESYKHYKNDILVRDMLPCKVMYISSDLSVDGKSHSNEDGLWDLVANRFYPKSSASGSINVLGNRTNILKLK